MYNLDSILDEVRAKYYVSSLLPRPSISWSQSKITAYFGVYNLHDNHITVSKILDTPDIPLEDISAIVYHESLHQDFAEHDRKFNLRVNKFPRYKEIQQNLNEYGQWVSSTMVYDTVIACYEKDYDKITYLVLPYCEDYLNAFTFYNGNIYIEHNANISSDNEFTVFLVDNGSRYHIVGWARNVQFLTKKVKVQQEKIGGKSFFYKAYAPRNDVKLLFEQTCTYGIEKSNFPKEIQKYKYYTCKANDKDTKLDIQYINTYCEGFNDLGLDLATIDTAAPYVQREYKEISKIVLSEYGFRKLWASNALCSIEKNSYSLYLKAIALRQCGMIKLAYETMKQSYALSEGESYILDEMIINCALANDFKLGNVIINKLATTKNENIELNQSITFLKKGI